LPELPTTAVGALATPTKTDDDADEYSPVPELFTAATLKTYDVPLVNRVTVAVLDVEIPSAKVDQVDPEFDEN